MLKRILFSVMLSLVSGVVLTIGLAGLFDDGGDTEPKAARNAFLTLVMWGMGITFVAVWAVWGWRG